MELYENKQKHIIGDGSSYDSDMTIIESMIRAKNKKDDIISQASLFTYYISQIYNYWGNFKEIITTLKPVKTENPGWEQTIYENNNDQRKYIIENLEYYEGRFLNLVNETQNSFEKTKKVNIHDIFTIFNYIGALSCLQTSPETIEFQNDEYELEEYRAFPFPNNTGLFGFNTYLHAFFNNILLVGVPKDNIAYYDNKSGCPLSFISHDFGHNYIMIYGRLLGAKTMGIKNDVFLDDVFRYKQVYNVIINDIESRKSKELFILFIWIMIHELIMPFSDIKHLTIDDIIYTNFSFIDEFKEEFSSFSNILDNPDILSEISGKYPNIIDYLDMYPDKQYYILVMAFGCVFLPILETDYIGYEDETVLEYFNNIN